MQPGVLFSGYCGRRLFTAATDGSTGAVQVGDPELDTRDALWSPDGTMITFGGSDASTIRLYVMAPDGTDVRPIEHVQRRRLVVHNPRLVA